MMNTLGQRPQDKTEMPIIRNRFVMPARPTHILAGEMDPLQWQIGKARFSQRKDYEQIDDVD